MIRISLLTSAVLLYVGSWTIAAAHDAPGRERARVILTLNTARRPEPMLADPARHQVYVGNESGAAVTVLNDRTNRPVSVIAVGHEVEDLALDGSTARLYTANRKSSSVSVVDTRSLRVTATIVLPHPPSGLAVDAARHHLFVTSGATNTVDVVNLRTLRLVRTIRVPGGPEGIGIDTGLNRIFVGLTKRAQIAVIDGINDRRIAIISVGAHPVHPIRVNSTLHRVYVVSSGSSTLASIDSSVLRVTSTIATGRHPEGIDVNSAGTIAYVSNEGDPGTDKNAGKTVSILDLRRGTMLETVRVHLGPDGVAYDSSVGRLYVCNETPHTVSVVALPPRER